MRVDVEGRALTLSNLDKVLYPRTSTTKGEVLDYYARAAPVLLPQLHGRAVTRVRWPDGVGSSSFFEKNIPSGAPSWIRRVRVRSNVFPVCEDLATLTWLANTAALELHVHQWRVTPEGDPLPADRIVIDLDPGEPAGLPEACQVALLVRELVTGLGLALHPVASGSKGLHLYIPLPAPVPDPSGVARQIAEQLQSAYPNRVISSMTKEKRGGKVFLDWSQNNPAKTTVAPWSLRGRDRPTVAAPLTWDEVEEGAEDPLAIEQPTISTALSRLDDHLSDF
ncbi:non-homologous end-joining DNA ligase [Nocardioides sp. Kera G14]|uniref:non-homologous end-joining DNA ligase n=1 Tax=Nocardioides sp. Kera G14 TaxID=2884264 RepID=UPI001D10AE32|nr:non-homologous end-joining DNA ligase [Nocardioides sp. Kera G14]UDY22816.1 non-homologous end-joining DNA ligase [Nocardioides sp. Kera G14]